MHYKVREGTRKRSIVSHNESPSTGMLSNFLLMLPRSKSNKDADYYTEMNHDMFFDPLKSKAFPQLQSRKHICDVILD